MKSARFALFRGLVPLALASLLPAQTLDVTGTVTVVDADIGRSPMAYVGGTYYYPYTGSTIAGGTATGHAGFVSLSGVAPASIAYDYNSLVLSGYTPGPAYSIETYTPGAGSAFHFKVGGNVVASGEVIFFEVKTDYYTGLATATGELRLTTPGFDPAFYNEVSALSGGTGLMAFSAPSVFPDLANNLQIAVFHSTGVFSVIPEPSAAAVIAGWGAAAALLRRRRRH